MATITTREQIAIAGIQDILRREDYQPELLKDMAKALAKARNVLPPPDMVIVRNKSYSLTTIEERLAQFIHYLPSDNRPEITDTSFYDENFLNQLISTIDEVSGLTPSAEAKVSMDAVIPANLQELLEAQAKTTADMKKKLGRPSQLQQQIEQAQEINTQAQLLRVNVARGLIATLTKSSYVRDLQAIYGKEAVNQLLAKRVDLAVNQSITALALNQLGVSSPSQAAGYFAAQLEKNLKADRNLAVALAKIPKAERKNTMADAKNLAEDTARQVDPAAKAFQAEQKSSPIYRDNAKAIAQGETEAALVKAGQHLTAKQTARLTEALTKHRNPEMQSRILRRIIPNASAEARREILNRLQPAISILAKSSYNPTISETINENSLINLARTNPELFPFRLRTAIRGNKLSSGDMVALTIRLSQQLGQPPDYVMMRLAGISGKDLETHLNHLANGKPVFGLPTQPSVSPNNPIYSRLSAAQSGLNQIQASGEEFQTITLGFQNSWQSITQALDIGKAVRFNIGRLPPVNRMVSSVQTVFSGLRIQSGAVNSVFNFFSSVSAGAGKLGSAAAYPFRAVGSMVSTGWNNVKTWAGTQVKAGLAKAGSWLAKKGVTAAATKLGLVAVGKGAAALMAQAVPVAGQIAGVLTVLSILGDIGKFIWDHKKEIGLGLGGMFFLGQMLLAKALGFLGSAAWTLGGALAGGVLGMAFGSVGAFVGGIAGGLSGYLISSGALGAALSGLGSALGSAAAGFGSFLGALSAPSLVAGLGTTIATMGIGGLLIGTAITVFFTQPRTDSGMFAPTEKSSSFPRDGSGGGLPSDLPNALAVGSCPIQDPLISCGSLGSGHPNCEHGGRGYAFGVSIPILTMANQLCLSQESCPYYGLAVDVQNANDLYTQAPVALPKVCLEEDVAAGRPCTDDITWTVAFKWYNCAGSDVGSPEACRSGGIGWGVGFNGTGNGHSWTIYLNHIVTKPGVVLGATFKSQDVIGALSSDLNPTHLHIELNADGVPIRPDFLCR